MNPREAPTDAPEAIALPPQSSRLWFWLFATTVIDLGTVVVFRHFACGCHFHPEALAVSLLIPAWAFWMLLRARRPDERILAWLSFLMAAGWMGMSIWLNGFV